jgi:tetratricopeptide (TPR) repeat protein
MLADMECQVGDLAAAFELQGHARQHAERFGHAGFVRWLAAERVGEDYWTGRWDDAVSAADSVIAEAGAGVPNFMEGYCRATRGRIRLARNDVAGALADAERALEFARAAEDLQMLYPALAFSARAEIAVGSLERGGDLADELLALWTSKVDSYPTSAWAVDLAYALEPIDRGAALVDAARSVRTPTRWLDAAVALLTAEYRTASEGFSEIGSLPDEAFARLRGGQALFRAGRAAEAQAELKPAVAFYRRVGAETYLGEAEALAGSSFVAKT